MVVSFLSEHLRGANVFLPKTLQKWEDVMDKDRIQGSAHQVKGKFKEVAGKVTGDAKTEAEGTAEKTAGKVQNTVGGIKDAVKETVGH
jgi:uncharacterized protein YjbJ (UPF0337 family)